MTPRAYAHRMLPWSNAGCDRLAGWHEYVAFIMTIEACFVALAWLVWALLMRTRPERAPGLGRTAARSRTSLTGSGRGTASRRGFKR